MSNLALLDNVEHRDLKVRPDRGDMFGDHINQVLVFPNEFRALQRDYPIFFRKDSEEEYQAVALLGFERDENLFVRDGVWHASYIPAVQARGPFSILVSPGESGSLEPKVQIDLDSPAVSKDEGYGLFLPQGGYSPYLEKTMAVLRTLHDGVGFSRAFFTALEKYDLIEPLSMEIKVNDTLQYSVPGIYSVSQEKFESLPAEALHDMHQSGALAACYWVLGSVDNIGRLVDIKADLVSQ